MIRKILILIIIIFTLIFMSCNSSSVNLGNNRAKTGSIQNNSSSPERLPLVTPDESKQKPKLLLYSFIHPDYLKDTAEFWGTKTGFSGFMISYVYDWHISPEKMKLRMPKLKAMNDECRKYGIDKNFVKISMGHLKDLDWVDEKQWKEILDHTRFAAKYAREAGFVGIALDTEPYYRKDNSIWDWKNERYKGMKKSDVNDLVYKRGRELMSVIKEEFPESEFIIFPEGYYYYSYPAESTSDTKRIYNLWGSFFKGLCDAGLESGIVLGIERTYHVTNKGLLEKRYYLVNKTMRNLCKGSDYWNDKCSVAIGLAPLGKKFKDKSARYPYGGFENQLEVSVKLCKRYVWIYGHGAAWWKLDDENKYRTRGFTYWRPYYQILDCDPLIDKYYKATFDFFRTGDTDNNIEN